MIKYLGVLASAFCLIFSSLVNAAMISATTRQSIQGHAPEFTPEFMQAVADGTAYPMGLSFGDQNYYDNKALMNAIKHSFDRYVSTHNDIRQQVAQITTQGLSNEASFVDINGDVITYPVFTLKPMDFKFIQTVNGNEPGTSPAWDMDASSGLTRTLCEYAAIDYIRTGSRPYFGLSLDKADIVLNTQFGTPNTASVANPFYKKVIPIELNGICNVVPGYLEWTNSLGNRSKNPNIYKSGFDVMGFVPQTEVNNQPINFPTTGADGLFFFLRPYMTDFSKLSWQTVTVNGITATPTLEGANIKVTLSGPKATAAQQASASPNPAQPFTKGTTIEIVGKDSKGNKVISYSFTLTKWFINRGSVQANVSDALTWCDSLGNGGANYKLPSVFDLSNAQVTWDALPGGTSSNNNAQVTIGDGDVPHPLANGVKGGLVSEWRQMSDYGWDISKEYWGHEIDEEYGEGFYVSLSYDGSIDFADFNLPKLAVCVSVP